MLGLLRLSWRNIWRNRRRTLISMSAIALGLVVVLVMGSVVKRMVQDAQEQLDATGMGHIEISAAGWRARRPVQNVMVHPEAVRATLAVPAGADVAARLLCRGLLGSAHGNEAVEVYGVDWHEELAVAGYLRTLSAGALPAASDLQGVVVGDALAAQLKLAVGQKLRLTAQRADGEIGAQLFRVRGIYHATSAKLAERRVLIGRAAFADLVGVEGAHQIVVQLAHASDAAPLAAHQKKLLRDAGFSLEVLTYAEIFPMYAQMEEMVDAITVVMSIFVYFLVGLGILNTMLMSVLERTRELGVLQALGTRPRSIIALILAESFWIASLSVVIGLALGLGINAAGAGGLLDYTKEMGESVEFGGAVIGANFRTEASLRDAAAPAAFVYVMALVVGLLPAWRITRLPIVEALRAK